MKLTPRTVLLSLLWLAMSCASNPAYAEDRTFPVALDVVVPFRGPKLIPATHLTVWQRDVSGKLGVEWWAPVLALDDAKLSFGSAAVLSYSTGDYSAYLGLVGQVGAGELPHSGAVFGFRATVRF